MEYEDHNDQVLGCIHQLHQHIECLHERVTHLEASLPQLAWIYPQPVPRHPIPQYLQNYRAIEAYNSLSGSLDSVSNSFTESERLNYHTLLLLHDRSFATASCESLSLVKSNKSGLSAQNSHLARSRHASAKYLRLPADAGVGVYPPTSDLFDEAEFDNLRTTSDLFLTSMNEDATFYTAFSKLPPPPQILEDVNESTIRSSSCCTALKGSVFQDFSVPPLTAITNETNKNLIRRSLLRKAPDGSPPPLPVPDDPLTPKPHKSDSTSRKRSGFKVSPLKQLPPLPELTEALPDPSLSNGSDTSAISVEGFDSDHKETTETHNAHIAVAQQLKFTSNANHHEWHRDLINFRNDLMKSPGCYPETITEIFTIIFYPGLLPLSAEREMGLRLLNYCQEALASVPPRSLNSQELTDIFAYAARVAKKVRERWAQRQRERV